MLHSCRLGENDSNATDIESDEEYTRGSPIVKGQEVGRRLQFTLMGTRLTGVVVHVLGRVGGRRRLGFGRARLARGGRLLRRAGQRRFQVGDARAERVALLGRAGLGLDARALGGVAARDGFGARPGFCFRGGFRCCLF